MVIDIHNPLSSKLTNIHNSFRNEVLIKFNLNDLYIKAFDEFIIDLLSSILEIHLKLQKLKSSPLQPFGGSNIMFLGDFKQFPPISDTPFYTSNIKPPLTFTKQTQKKKSLEKVYGKTM